MATTAAPVKSGLDQLADQLGFIVGVTEPEMRTMLTALAPTHPDILADLIDGIRLARLDRDADAVRRAVAERGTL